jgi:hypothetical protein
LAQSEKQIHIKKARETTDSNGYRKKRQRNINRYSERTTNIKTTEREDSRKIKEPRENNRYMNLIH